MIIRRRNAIGNSYISGLVYIYVNFHYVLETDEIIILNNVYSQINRVSQSICMQVNDIIMGYVM